MNPSIHHQLNDLDFDAVGNNSSAFPGLVDGKRENHGTNCAGIIAMEKSNNKCGVGVAYHSSITGTAHYIVLPQINTALRIVATHK